MTYPRNEKFAAARLDYCFLTPGLARRVREARVDDFVRGLRPPAGLGRARRVG